MSEIILPEPTQMSTPKRKTSSSGSEEGVRKRVKKSNFTKYCEKLEIPMPLVNLRELSHFEECEDCRTFWPLYLYDKHYIGKLPLHEVSNTWAELKEEARQSLSRQMVKKHSASAKSLTSKRALSGYQIFLTEKRQQIQRENPQASFADCTKLIALCWNELSETQQAVLQTRAVQAKAEREEKLLHMPKFLKLMLQKKSQSARDKKKEFRPTKPPNSFLLFVASRKGDKQPEMKHVEFLKLQGERWKQMTNDEKAPFLEAANKLRQAYLIEKAKMEPQPIIEPTINE